jgi:hypothetical protein
MNRVLTPKYYSLLAPLKQQGALSSDELADALDLSTVTVDDYARLLNKEQLVVRKGIHKELIQITPAGFAWQEEKPVIKVNVPKWPCGHVKVDSTDFCLWCHNTDRWKEYQTNGSRYYMPTMKQAMER